MRIIGGKHKSRRLTAPKNLPVRPTTDKTKESIFNILNSYFTIEEVEVLDLFSGTGNMAYEFASRGAKSVIAVDKDYRCVSYIRKTVAVLKLDVIKPIKMDALQFVERNHSTYDIIFADPPYQMENIDMLPDLVLGKDLLKEDGWFILEHSSENDFSEHPDLFQVRHYGRTILSIFLKREKTQD